MGVPGQFGVLELTILRPVCSNVFLIAGCLLLADANGKADQKAFDGLGADFLTVEVPESVPELLPCEVLVFCLVSASLKGFVEQPRDVRPSPQDLERLKEDGLLRGKIVFLFDAHPAVAGLWRRGLRVGRIRHLRALHVPDCWRIVRGPAGQMLAW